MRFAVAGMMVIIVMVAAGLTASAQPGQAPAANPSAAIPVGIPGVSQRDEQTGLMALVAPAGDNRQQITVIDPRTMVMTVYHIELSTGTIELKSARKIQWDLQMVHFNGTSPLPQEIRTKIEQLK